MPAFVQGRSTHDLSLVLRLAGSGRGACGHRIACSRGRTTRTAHATRSKPATQAACGSPLPTAHGTWRMGPRRSMPAHAPRRLARPVTCGCSSRPACDPCVPPGTRAGPPCRFGDAGFLWTDDRALLGPQWRTQLAIRAAGRNATKDMPGASRTGPRCARGATEAPCRAAMTPVAASRRPAQCRLPEARGKAQACDPVDGDLPIVQRHGKAPAQCRAPGFGSRGARRRALSATAWRASPGHVRPPARRGRPGAWLPGLTPVRAAPARTRAGNSAGRHRVGIR